ncbi:hypothetical protein DXT91_16540 [Agrobacterium tumefaciens]|uniref:hypothetical protein n=1 Tax=Agrobacterium tumefaciens TaxID=358 RepID=UPI0012B7F5D6|nr:hypothetical protein [Agrobacterium tumefaciens]MQB05725.1 hypothetical protein [Agrobacterium tumefaciens]
MDGYNIITATASALTAITTVVYTIGTFLLWKSTQNQILNQNQQLLNQQQQLRSTAQSEIISSHRSLFLTIIQNESLLKHISSSENTDQTRRSMLASMLINHCGLMYTEYKAGNMPLQNMSGFTDDAADLFSIRIVNERWHSVKAFHDKSFAKFIDEEVLPKVRVREHLF